MSRAAAEGKSWLSVGSRLSKYSLQGPANDRYGVVIAVIAPGCDKAGWGGRWLASRKEFVQCVAVLKDDARALSRRCVLPLESSENQMCHAAGNRQRVEQLRDANHRREGEEIRKKINVLIY